MFFQVLGQYLGPDVDPIECDTDELIDDFIEKYMHSRPLTWLDAEVKTHFDIDIFKHPFPIEMGYTSISQANVSLLILRCDLDDRAKAQAIADFIGLDEFEIVRSNVSSEKSYASQYTQFKQRIKIPPDLLEQMYDSKFARHFYSREERELFRERWSSDTTIY